MQKENALLPKRLRNTFVSYLRLPPSNRKISINFAMKK
jgi:hypothetical protein